MAIAMQHPSPATSSSAIKLHYWIVRWFFAVARLLAAPVRVMQPLAQHEGKRKDQHQAADCNNAKSCAPAIGFNDAFQKQRPDGSRNIIAAGSGRHRYAAIPFEPVGDIGNQRSETRRCGKADRQLKGGKNPHIGRKSARCHNKVPAQHRNRPESAQCRSGPPNLPRIRLPAGKSDHGTGKGDGGISPVDSEFACTLGNTRMAAHMPILTMVAARMQSANRVKAGSPVKNGYWSGSSCSFSGHSGIDFKLFALGRPFGNCRTFNQIFCRTSFACYRNRRIKVSFTVPAAKIFVPVIPFLVLLENISAPTGRITPFHPVDSPPPECRFPCIGPWRRQIPCRHCPQNTCRCLARALRQRQSRRSPGQARSRMQKTGGNSQERGLKALSHEPARLHTESLVSDSNATVPRCILFQA